MTSVPVLLLALLHVAPAAWSVYHILLYKRDHRAAISWITICLFIPYAGPVAYFLFGINRVMSRALSIKRGFLSIEYEAGDRRFTTKPNVPQGLKAIGERITGNPLSKGNGVDALHNGENVYPKMIESINAAKSQILLATYIFKTDQIGTTFADALAAAVSRGVSVYVLVDGIGELYSTRRPSTFLRKRGITVARFLPPRLFPPSIYLNLRNHRKLLIVDQEIAYAGGMNIGNANIGTNEKPRTVTDVHFCLRGPIVASLTEIFSRDWNFSTGEVPDWNLNSTAQATGNSGCRVIPDGPDEQIDALSLTLQAAIGTALQRVYIMTPYFVPSRELIASLQSAALRGVLVRIVLPAKNNLFYMNWANRNALAELLKVGIEIYYQPGPFCHSKLLCIDNEYSLVGSANLDPRSLRLNFELCVEVFSEELNLELCTHMETVTSTSASLDFDELSQRSIPTRLRDSLASLMSPYI